MLLTHFLRHHHVPSETQLVLDLREISCSLMWSLPLKILRLTIVSWSARLLSLLLIRGSHQDVEHVHSIVLSKPQLLLRPV